MPQRWLMSSYVVCWQYNRDAPSLVCNWEQRQKVGLETRCHFLLCKWPHYVVGSAIHNFHSLNAFVTSPHLLCNSCGIRSFGVNSTYIYRTTCQCINSYDCTITILIRCLRFSHPMLCVFLFLQCLMWMEILFGADGQHQIKVNVLVFVRHFQLNLIRLV